ncbi:MAG TPA: hypothetical protein V6D22_24820 [Candidatus Obscuribacterales bacterium]
MLIRIPETIVTRIAGRHNGYNTLVGNLVFLMCVLAKLLTACICGLLLLSACASNDAEVTFKSGGMTHTFVQGEAATKDFPLPLYPKATAVGSNTASGDSDDEHFMMLSSSDPTNKVSDFYLQELKKAGWSAETSGIIPEGAANKGNSAGTPVMIVAHKPGFEANVMISPEDKQTAISLSVSKQSNEKPKLSGQEFTPDKLNPPTD